MEKTSRYYLVGLWRVWDRRPDARDPFASAPDAFIERLAVKSNHEIKGCECENALGQIEHIMRTEGEYAHIEHVASIVVGVFGWNAMRDRSAWDAKASCRHEPGSNHLQALHVYDVQIESLQSICGEAWVPARRKPRSFEAVIERARKASAAAGIPEYESFGENVPFFIRPQDEEKTVRHKRRRNRDGGSLG